MKKFERSRSEDISQKKSKLKQSKCQQYHNKKPFLLVDCFCILKTVQPTVQFLVISSLSTKLLLVTILFSQLSNVTESSSEQDNQVFQLPLVVLFCSNWQ